MAVINGTSGIDVLAGLDTEDTDIWGLGGNDTLIGGNGLFTTRFYYSGVLGYDNGIDEFQGHAAGDTIIRDKSGAHMLDFSATTLTNISLIDAGNSNDTVIGSNGTDIIYGNTGNDNISGGGGNYAIEGGAGTDMLLVRAFDGADWSNWEQVTLTTLAS